jgi:hypothetical protein
MLKLRVDRLLFARRVPRTPDPLAYSAFCTDQDNTVSRELMFDEEVYIKSRSTPGASFVCAAARSTPQSCFILYLSL